MAKQNELKKRRFSIQLAVFVSAMLIMGLIALHYKHILTLPNPLYIIFVIWISIAVAFAIAEFTEDIIKKRKSEGIIITIICNLFMLPLMAVSIVDTFISQTNSDFNKFIYYLIGYSINIIYCILNRDIVERNSTEFKIALYMSAGLYALTFSLLSLLGVDSKYTGNTTRAASIFTSFAICRAIIEYYSLKQSQNKK